MLVIVVRHGETDWNAAKRVQGHSDIPLNQEGLEQAAAAATVLAQRGVKFDRAYCSDLARAAKTAEIICLATNSVVPEQRQALRERHMGALEGQSLESAWNSHPQGKPKFQVDYANARASHVDVMRNDIISTSGESMAQVRARLVNAYTEIIKDAEAHGASNVLIVGHGMALRAMLVTLIQQNKLRTRLDHGMSSPLKNCSLTTIKDSEIVSYNETVVETPA